jgi:hypothetical protein
VDVSGKGIDAGTRSLLLSGALGGLLGSLRPEEFLPAANRYLDRQAWDEGFATAVHLVLDLADGRFSVESAGHPPVAHFHGGSGRWCCWAPRASARGRVPVVSYVPETGPAGPRATRCCSTPTGLVDAPGRDLVVGSDTAARRGERLVGTASRAGHVLVRQWRGAANERPGLVLLWRQLSHQRATGAGRAPAPAVTSRKRLQHRGSSDRRTSTVPREARCSGLRLRVRDSRKPASSSPRRTCSSRRPTFDAVPLRWNIDSPQKTEPTSTPYSPPTSGRRPRPRRCAPPAPTGDRCSSPYASRMRPVIHVPSPRSAHPATTWSKAVSTLASQPHERSRARSDRRTTTASAAAPPADPVSTTGSGRRCPAASGTSPRRTSRWACRSSVASCSPEDGQGKQPAR